ncbi:Na/Pi cotransporter family protein [Solibacillus sp. CAU 1738]|uniref:Na/Pi cotransporter family protein n=1 Tax=Solibacillus sp. CAU 1738 TaxID=3140363 RepID=UPI0032600F44
MIFHFLGGLGLFLFAIKFMGDGLQKVASNRLRDILNTFTTNPFMGVLVGIAITLLTQSSTATTVITVSLVSAKFLTLRQAIGIIMGANIGTTVTVFIIGIDVGEIAYPILAIGAMLLLMKKSALQHIGQVLFGFAGLFIGIEMMTNGMQPLHQWQAFIDFTVHIEHMPVLSIFAGAIFTLIVQASSATVSILQNLYAEHLITIQSALPVLFGENIGTTVTVVIASLGASIVAKRAAAIHVLFNVIGTIIFMIFLIPFSNYVEWIANLLHLEPKMQIAVAHGSFNIINTIIQLPFTGVLAWIVTKLLPGEEYATYMSQQQLDKALIPTSPGIALSQVKQEVIRMGEYCVQSLDEALQYLLTCDRKHASTAAHLEEAINQLDVSTTTYLVSLSKQSLSSVDSTFHYVLLDNIRDLERIGDHSENIIELIDYKEKMNVPLSTVALEELQKMFELTIATVSLTIRALDQRNIAFAKDVLVCEEQIDAMEQTLRERHIERLNNCTCASSASLIYADILSNLERISDHAVNIAETVIKVQ